MTREVIEQLEKTYKECVDLGQTCGKDSVFWKRAEAIKVALEQGDVLREIRQEIAGFRDDAEIRYGHQLGFDKIYAYERCINLIDGKIKELGE